MAIPNTVTTKLRKIAAGRQSGAIDHATARAQIRVVLRETDAAEVVLQLLISEADARVGRSNAEARLRAAIERSRSNLR